MSNMTTYRTNALVKEDKKITHGLLTAPAPHVHEFPGFFKRLFKRIFMGVRLHRGTLFRCSCGSFAKWNKDYDNFFFKWIVWDTKASIKKEWLTLGGSLLDGENEN